jgi:hypothetical protein
VAGGEATAGDGAGEFTRGMFVCMLRVVGSYTKINTKWFLKKFNLRSNPLTKFSYVRKRFLSLWVCLYLPVVSLLCNFVYDKNRRERAHPPLHNHSRTK